MRVPFSEVYRAFPELDGFSDERCAEFVSRARRRHRMSQAIFLLVAVVAAVGTWIAVGILWGLVIRATGVGYHDALLVVILGSTIVAGALSALLVRDRWLRWAVGEQIDAARCPDCGYALLGLPVIDDALTCPECGHRHWLPELDLTAEQVLAVRAPDEGGAASVSPFVG